MLPRVMAYLDALEAQGRYQLMVWPVHCQMGSWGHGIHAQLQEALNDWSDSSARNVQVVSKGENPWTEHYSALQAEVPDSQDPGTLLNHGLLERLRQSDRILVAGEAGSHCVRATVEHLLTHLQTSEIEKLVLLTDCISPVAGFEAEQKAFFQTCVDAGATLIKSTEVEL
jgi:nicotinamidase-related amidase